LIAAAMNTRIIVTDLEFQVVSCKPLPCPHVKVAVKSQNSIHIEEHSAEPRAQDCFGSQGRTHEEAPALVLLE
jgi:hypothetical protein